MHTSKTLLATLILSTLLPGMTPSSAAGTLEVVASFSIIGDFAREVGGDRINLRTVVGPNGDAHVHNPKPSDAIAMAGADVILVNGLQFEGFLTRLIEASGTSAPVMELTQGAEIIRDPAGGHYHYYDGKAVFHEAAFDPHAWQSVANAKVYVTNIAAAFCDADSAGCDAYRSNAADYLDQLSKLDDEIRARIAAIPRHRRTVVVAHNAFRYFEREYGLTFLSPVGVSTESEASAADVAGIVQEIRDKRAATVFAENIADARLVEQIAAEAGLELGGVLYSDALSDGAGPAPTYVEMMRHNARTISQTVVGP